MIRIALSTGGRTDFIDVTARVAAAVAEHGSGSGVATVFVPHTTAGITVNENADPSVVTDMIGALDRMAPWDGPYRHAEGNAAAHIKAALLGTSVQIVFEEARLCLGRWQGLYFCEFDGPRERELWLRIS